jgi:hypothetical protein
LSPENKKLKIFFKIALELYLGFATENVNNFFSRVKRLRGQHKTVPRATGWTALHPEV